MNKVINNVLYDTEKAHKICEGNYGRNKSITLYQMPNREFFEHHQLDGDDWSEAGEWILPISRDDAKKFAQEVMTGDEYRKFEREADIRYSFVKCDYFDDGFWCVDAWKTDDDNEPGEVVAVIHESGDVYYIDKLAKSCPLVQEVIEQKKTKMMLEKLDEAMKSNKAPH